MPLHDLPILNLPVFRYVVYALYYDGIQVIKVPKLDMVDSLQVLKPDPSSVHNFCLILLVFISFSSIIKSPFQVIIFLWKKLTL